MASVSGEAEPPSGVGRGEARGLGVGRGGANPQGSGKAEFAHLGSVGAVVALLIAQMNQC